MENNYTVSSVVERDSTVKHRCMPTPRIANGCAYACRCEWFSRKQEVVEWRRSSSGLSDREIWRGCPLGDQADCCW